MAYASTPAGERYLPCSCTQEALLGVPQAYLLRETGVSPTRDLPALGVNVYGLPVLVQRLLWHHEGGPGTTLITLDLAIVCNQEHRPYCILMFKLPVHQLC